MTSFGEDISAVCYGKGEVHPRTGHEGPEGKWRYSCTLSLTSAVDGVGGQSHAPATLPPGKTRYPLYRRLGGLQNRSGRVRKISFPPGFDPRTVQPVASRYKAADAVGVTSWRHTQNERCGCMCRRICDLPRTLRVVWVVRGSRQAAPDVRMSVASLGLRTWKFCRPIDRQCQTK